MLQGLSLQQLSKDLETNIYPPHLLKQQGCGHGNQLPILPPAQKLQAACSKLPRNNSVGCQGYQQLLEMTWTPTLSAESGTWTSKAKATKKAGADQKEGRREGWLCVNSCSGALATLHHFYQRAFIHCHCQICLFVWFFA